MKLCIRRVVLALPAVVALGGYVQYLAVRFPASVNWLPEPLLTVPLAVLLAWFCWLYGYRVLVHERRVWLPYIPLYALYILVPAMALALALPPRSYKNPLGIHKYVLLTAWVVVVVAAAAVLARSLWERFDSLARWRQRRLVMALAVLSCLAALPAVRLHGIHGDEPTYLWIASSIMADFDLDLSNNVDRSLWERLVAFPAPDGTVRHFSKFNPVYPLLLIPGLFLGGINGAFLIEMVIAVALSWQTYLLLVETFPGRRAAFWAWLAVTGTPPFVNFTTHLYTELTAGLLAVWAVRNIVRKESGTGVLAAGISIAALPWLHYRYVYLSLVLFMLLLWRGRRATARLAAALAIIVVAAAGLLLYRAQTLPPGMVDGATLIDVTNYPSQIARFFLDQECGLFFLSPLYLLLPLGIAWSWPQRTPPVYVGLALLAIFGLFHGIFVPWDVGSVGGRYITPVLPFLALLLVPLFERRGTMVRTVVIILLGSSLLIGVIHAVAPVFRYEYINGTNRLAQMINPDLPQLLPSFALRGTISSAPFNGRSYLWLAGIAGVNTMLYFLARSPKKELERN